MNLYQFSKIILLSSSLLLFTACGEGDDTTPNVKELAISRIEAYADNNNQTAPTIEDYINAGVQGVTADNIEDINALVDSLTAEDVDTTEEIKALVANLDVNLVPIANRQTISLNEDSSKAIILIGTDADGDELTYIVKTNPNHGTLSGTAPNLTYTPIANYFGDDSFTFKVNDGESDSNIATVNISVIDVAEPDIAPVDVTDVVEPNIVPVNVTDVAESNITPVNVTEPNITPVDVAEPNIAPVVNTQNITLNEDTSKALTLTASDADGDTLTYTVLTDPSHGTLSGTAPNLTYTPIADYFGDDHFTFKVNDGEEDSNIATVNINVTDVAEPDVAPVPTDETNKTINLDNFINDVNCDQVLEKEFSTGSLLSICYDYGYKSAKYVAYTLDGTLVNEVNIDERPLFYTESEIPDEYKILYSDYTRSGYDRGHLAPDADFDYNEEDLNTIYTLANIIPQDPNVNRHFWIKVEYQERLVATTLGELSVINGVVFDKDPDYIGTNRIAVSKGFWKILYNDEKEFRQCYYYDNFVLEDADLDTLDKHKVDCNSLIIEDED